MLSQYMERLSVDLGNEQSLAPNEDGSYSLHLEPDLHIFLRENLESGITMITTVSLLPDQNKETFLLKTMSANLLGRETGGSALGLDKEGKKVILLNILSGQAAYKDFHDTLEDFVNYAESWREEIKEFMLESNENAH